MLRIGHGYDVHALVPERKLILGGVEIPFEKGLLGHSDADVLVHAIMDALLGAVGLGSIGDHFPDTDPQYQGISSLQLLSRVGDLLRNIGTDEAGYRVINIDSTIAAQAPKLAGSIPKMCYNIALALGVEERRISVKATTTERLGFVGREEGMAAYAVCLIENSAR